MYKTTILVEVEVETQFGPENAVTMLQHLLDVPAIESINVEITRTSYVPSTSKDANISFLTNTKHTLK